VYSVIIVKLLDNSAPFSYHLLSYHNNILLMIVFSIKFIRTETLRSSITPSESISVNVVQNQFDFLDLKQPAAPKKNKLLSIKFVWTLFICHYFKFVASAFFFLLFIFLSTFHFSFFFSFFFLLFIFHFSFYFSFFFLLFIFHFSFYFSFFFFLSTFHFSFFFLLFIFHFSFYFSFFFLLFILSTFHFSFKITPKLFLSIKITNSQSNISSTMSLAKAIKLLTYKLLK
jgi:hypothetical protein